MKDGFVLLQINSCRWIKNTHEISEWVPAHSCAECQSAQNLGIFRNKYLFAKHPECEELFEFTETSDHHDYNSKDGFLKGLGYSLCGNGVHCYINEDKG